MNAMEKSTETEQPELMDADPQTAPGIRTVKTDKKKPRQRMKGLLENIRNQMEFYFGNANINKDRFMKDQLDGALDGYLPLSLFLKFAKMKKLTDSTEVIAKALKKSDLLEVSEDRTKVRRTCPVNYLTEEEVDERTVYVEGLPPIADHDWVAQCFSVCGKVTYVSLPRYKTTGDIKGFAFVEFETPEEAAKAIEKLNQTPEQEDECHKVANIKLSKNLKYWKKRAQKEGIDPEKKEKADDNIKAAEGKENKKEIEKEQQGKKKKRKRRANDSGLEESEQTAKRVKKGDAEILYNSPKTLKQSTEKESSQTSPEDGREIVAVEVSLENKSVKDECQLNIAQEVKEDSISEAKGSTGESTEPLAEQSARKRKRKRESGATEFSGLDCEAAMTKKTKGVEENEEKTLQDVGKGEEETEMETNAKKKKLKVKQTSKKPPEQSAPKETEWKKGKRKSTDRIETDQAKRTRKDGSHKTGEAKVKDGLTNKRKRKRSKKVKKDPPRLRVMSKLEWSQLKRDYLDHQRASMASLKQQLHSICSSAAQSSGRHTDAGEQKSRLGLRSSPEFQPNVIIKITSEEPMSYKQLRQRIPRDVKVAYVDVKDDELHGHIRCKDPDSAQKLVAFALPRCTLHLVQDEEEREYWNKILMDRQIKLTNPKRPKKKGSAKLLEKAQNVMLESMKSSHIMFEEDWSDRQVERHDEENISAAQD